MYTYLKMVKSPDNFLTYSEIVKEIITCFDIRSGRDAAPKAVISYLLNYHEDNFGPKLYKLNDKSEYMIKSVYNSIDYVKSVFSKIDSMLNDITVIRVDLDEKMYYLHRSGVELTTDMKKEAHHVNIKSILGS